MNGFQGATAIRSFLEDWIGAYDEYEYKQEEGQDLGNGVLFAVASLGGRVAGSAGRAQTSLGMAHDSAAAGPNPRIALAPAATGPGSSQ